MEFEVLAADSNDSVDLYSLSVLPSHKSNGALISEPCLNHILIVWRDKVQKARQHTCHVLALHSLDIHVLQSDLTQD